MEERHRNLRFPHRVCGVDFSGAQDAGKKIWIALGLIEGKVLRIEDCRQAAELPGSGGDIDRSLSALRVFIAASSDCAFGLDFPFGLPLRLIGQDTWEGFVRSFPGLYSSADEFREACRRATGKREIRRLTDEESRTPFSPYNLRLYKQTYFGIRDVLAPLIRSEQACVLPMQPARVGMAWVLEICPASTLKRRRLSLSYKKRGQEPLAARLRILEAVEAATPMSIPDEIRSRIVQDHEGDALDSVVAASSVFASLPRITSLGMDKREYTVEGYVYV